MVGELHCLNCGRYLADVIGAEAGQWRLRAPAGLATRPILVVQTPHGPRCGRCRGLPVVEPLPTGEMDPAALDHAARTPAAA